MIKTKKDIKELSINTIRFLAIDAIQKANSGHPGMPMGCAPIAFLLYKKIMKHNPANPSWINRDRFILSAGHGSMLLYSVLYLSGYDISVEDLKNFRQWGSITPGHPEYSLTPGVETTTGPLGQGITNAIGMAVAQSFLAEKFNKEKYKLIDHYIYAIVSDGDLMEGVSHEAASFAGHNKLSSLILFYDANQITIDGDLSLTMSEDVGARFRGYGWHVQNVEDVNNVALLETAVNNAQSETGKPSIIITNTHIGFGSPNKQDTSSAHGSPLGEEEVKLTKRNMDWPEDYTFYIPEEVQKYFNSVKESGGELEENWNELFEKYSIEYPEEASLFNKIIKNDFGNNWKNKLIEFENWDTKIATRSASGKVLELISIELPTLIGGSADLTPSNNTSVKSFENFSAENKGGRYIHYGIREHAMAGMMNGMAMYGGIIPYGGTFLVFSDYMRPSIRLACMSKLKTIYVFTHDSIGLGEDGPTHQPIEHVSSLRAIPNLTVIRPADANETVYAWQAAIELVKGPVALVFTRQKVNLINRKIYSSAEGLLKGAYILKDTTEIPEIILIASGSEVEITVDTAVELEKNGTSVRVVSMPSWELFEQQSEEYKESVFPKNVKVKISIEAGVKHGWEKYVGDKGSCISIEKYGASAPYQTLFEKYGFTKENIISEVNRLLKRK